ncbi:hypothetical protein N825_26290 [Skermanella stibiiresistens SB22]|uniref:Uncharacterized protein n=1 Tax=Skermanella stibiiresistens SB22 TaxID=1385369 RepID=W9GVB5_9PROT|nr:hypothetical protein N825_26290 [Skermanella stibiiresistens SB22]
MKLLTGLRRAQQEKDLRPKLLRFESEQMIHIRNSFYESQHVPTPHAAFVQHNVLYVTQTAASGERFGADS